MKLYKVELRTEIVVLAKDEDDAEVIAEQCASDVPDWEAHAVDLQYLPDAWEDDCLPYNCEDDQTIGQLVSAGYAPKRAAMLKRTAKDVGR